MEKGFFGSLFDLSFTSFVTTKLIKVLYVLSLVLLVIGYVIVAIALFTSGGGSEVTIGDDGTLESSDGGSAAAGILWLLIIGPLILFFYTLFYRVLFELIIVLFRIFENTRDQLALTRAANPEAVARAAASEPAPGAAGPGSGPSGPNLPGTSGPSLPGT